MKKRLLFWTYLVNAILLINHEIDSAYWQEWKLINANIGISGFLIIHFVLIFLILYGLILLYEQKKAGYIFSLIFASVGIFAFFIHIYFLLNGGKEFNTSVSKFILYSTFIISIFQIYLSVRDYLKGSMFKQRLN